ncbi:DUF5994 family protein [Mycolicibacterium sp. 120270]|uniref:DUF5994 family protein n=1 Tax=Mycolicibacterium sp. 120270 TaxID=3090600 RepID=UPI00299D7EAF|nr:DUF5994 family protein [Mycolicibacterium sp. 120270]MDX1883294.1 DUF5994 family protein [Mycolicibacterium sp. 120270]
MNGLTGSRRLARPVRLTLAKKLGGDIDGAWWPYSNSVAQELYGLIEGLHEPLGEVVDIRINWPVTEGPLDLETLVNTSTRRVASGDCRRLRLMYVDGRRGRAKLLVVPHMTSADLGGLVMRGAAAMPVAGLERDSRMFATADLVVRTARTESAQWTAQMCSG